MTDSSFPTEGLRPNSLVAAAMLYWWSNPLCGVGFVLLGHRGTLNHPLYSVQRQQVRVCQIFRGRIGLGCQDIVDRDPVLVETLHFAEKIFQEVKLFRSKYDTASKSVPCLG